MTWIQAGRLVLQSEVDRSTAIPPHQPPIPPPTVPRVWVDGKNGQCILIKAFQNLQSEMLRNFLAQIF